MAFLRGSEFEGLRFLWVAFVEYHPAYWFQNTLVLNLWHNWIEGVREFKKMGIIRGGRNIYKCYQNYHLIKGWVHSYWRAITNG